MSNEKKPLPIPSLHKALPPLPPRRVPQTLPSDYTVTHGPTPSSSLSTITQQTSLPPENNASVNLIVPQTTSSDYTVTEQAFFPVMQKDKIDSMDTFANEEAEKEEVEEDDDLEEEKEEKTESFDPFLGATRLPRGAITLGDELGQGAFGQVYQGKWGERPVALKKIDLIHAKKNFPHMDEAQILESLQWEVSRLSTVSHPNLVQFYGIYQEASQSYIVMEFCEGGTLQNALTQKNISWSMRWQWALEITRGLAYLHDQGVLHRDLKAENMLLDRYGRAKLADLGVAQVDALLQEKEAKVVESGLQDKKFIAPENIDNPNLSTKATDIYALGLVFWQLATGKIPRRLQTLSEPEKKAWLTGQGIREPIPDNCPEGFKALILQCWQHDPKKRGDVESLGEHLKKLTETLHQKEIPWLSACNALDERLHKKRVEGLSYIAPYLTRQRVDEPIETYWQRWETKIAENTTSASTTPSSTTTPTSLSKTGDSTTITGGNPPLDLHQTLQDFIIRPGNRTLLLLGDSGLGKTLSVCLFADQLLGAWHRHRQTPTHPAPAYLPLLLRPALKNWSHSGLQQAFAKAIDYYGLKNTTIPLLVIIDGYDECQLDIAPQNLVTALGIPAQASVKLIVTCRPHTVEELQLTNRFAFQGQLETRYFLPFNIKQILGYLQDRLSWTEATHQQYQDKLKNTPAVRTVLRNPFVLSLLVQSWETIVKQDFKQLNRWMIYEGFVAHWLTTKRALLPPSVQRALKGHAANLIESFGIFASELAFTAFKQKGIALTYEQIQQLVQSSPWLTVETALKQGAYRRFLQRQAKLTEDQKRRALLTEEDYIQIMLGRGQQFALGAPLKARALGYEFTHKSFFEYFVAKRILNLATLDQAFAVKAGLDLLNTRPIQEESEVLDFLGEGWSEEIAKILTPIFFEMMKTSRRNSQIKQSSANAATMLNHCRVSFNGKDLSHVHLPGADLSQARLDNTNLHGAQLQNVTLRQAFLRETDLTHADLTGANFGEFPSIKCNSSVDCVAYSKDGEYLAMGVGYDVEVWAITPKWQIKIATFEEHQNKVMCIAFDPNGERMVSGSVDKTLKLWAAKTGKELATLKGHTDYVNSCAFDPKGERIVSGSEDKTLKLWAAQTGKELATLKGHTGSVNSCAFDPSGELMVSGSHDHTLKLWAAQTGKELATLKGHTGSVNSCAFDATGGRIVSGSEDNTLKLWDAQTFNELATLKGHTDYVNSCAFDPKGERIVSGSRDGTLKFWAAQTGKELATLKGHTGWVMSCAFDPTGECIVSGGGYGDNTLKLWAAQTGKELATLKGHTDIVTSCAFDPKGERIVSGGDKTVRLWAAKTGKELATLEVTSCAFDPTGELMVSGSSDKPPKLWDAQTFKALAMLEEYTGFVSSCAFDPKGERIVSGSGDTTLKLWAAQTGKELATLKGHTDFVTSCAFDPKGERIVSGSRDKTLKLWDAQTFNELATLDGHTKSVRSCAFDPKGERIISGGGKTLMLWDAQTGKKLATLEEHTGYVTSCAFDPTGERIVSGSTGTTLKLWDAQTGEELATLKGHTGWVLSCAFDPTGERIVSGSGDIVGKDNTVRLWDAQTGEELVTLKGHTGWVLSCAFDPTGERIVSGSEDTSIWVWESLRTDGTKWRVVWRTMISWPLFAEGALLAGTRLSAQNKTLLLQREAIDKGPELYQTSAKSSEWFGSFWKRGAQDAIPVTIVESLKIEDQHSLACVSHDCHRFFKQQPPKPMLPSKEPTANLTQPSVLPEKFSLKKDLKKLLLPVTKKNEKKKEEQPKKEKCLMM